jgi:hypothetical protein
VGHGRVPAPEFKLQYCPPQICVCVQNFIPDTVLNIFVHLSYVIIQLSCLLIVLSLSFNKFEKIGSKRVIHFPKGIQLINDTDVLGT